MRHRPFGALAAVVAAAVLSTTSAAADTGPAFVVDATSIVAPSLVGHGPRSTTRSSTAA